ncbi:homoserine dehydrogenase [Microvirga sp. STS02]|uniref:homoserine dehydrogenase n=1 Tax=Hymenobacter negativus TaxID=2795026 RepID=UPI0018DD0441|nr:MULTISPECIES: homoserine dehydrogenase [Bacteria]MBH8570534.1 homoserine dehydrogenase [Hymenobacter negativus]MBR7210273.1 homoserine dehydrogenase [Microvirga sp. STS02]
MNHSEHPLRLGLIGFGCVGQGFYDIIEQQPGLGLAVARIAVKSPNKPRTLPPDRFTYHADDLLHDPTLDVLVEVIDDAAEAFRLVSTALRQGRRVVTANKAMLARHLPELVQLEQEFGGILLYEAAVCGSIPVVRTLDSYFSHEPLRAVRGIFNGSSNYVLTRMSEAGSDYATALAEAQVQGFAETDPVLDMGAFDPRSKAVILAAHAYGAFLNPDEVLNLGIEAVGAADIAYAAARGQKVKVVASVERLPNGRVAALVTPQLLGPESPLYAVEQEFNGIIIDAEYAGAQFLTGRGAGGHPTGSAVLADVLALRRGHRYGYARRAAAPAAQLTEGLELDAYVSHPDAGVLREVLTWLELPPDALHPDSAYPYATGPVALQQLWAWRKELRAAGIFVARRGAVRPVANAVPAHAEVAAVA